MKKHYPIIVKHGKYIREPKCIVCGSDIEHSWLAGDYSLLLCSNKSCTEKHFNVKIEDKK